MFKKKSKFNWDEIYIQSQKNIHTLATESIPDDSFFDKKGLREKSEILELKKECKQYSKNKLEFFGENFIHTNLFGEISFNKEMDSPSVYLKQIDNLEIDSKAKLEKMFQFFEKNFIDDIEILEILSVYLIEEKRIADLVSICNKFLNKNLLPLKFQFFFILIGIYPNTLQNIILSGDENIIINILYKYKYLELNKNEKNLLYDTMISGKCPNLIGVVFQLFRNETKGIRNVFPILQIILNNFDSFSKDEKKEFVHVFQNTNQYLKTYFLMKKTFSILEIKIWIKKVNLLNGKDKAFIKNIEDKLAPIEEKNKLHKKFIFLKEAQNLSLLSPFEIILLSNSTLGLELKDELNKFYESNQNSYSANRSIAVLHFQNEDYRKFLLQISKSGNFKYQMEVLYLKAISYREIGMNEESKKIFQALKNRFPESDILLKEAGLK